MKNEIKKYLSRIGTKGGSAKTPAKSAASKANGAKGGRAPVRSDTAAQIAAIKARARRASERGTREWPVVPQSLRGTAELQRLMDAAATGESRYGVADGAMYFKPPKTVID